jgi:hypothetical protein
MINIIMIHHHNIIQAIKNLLKIIKIINEKAIQIIYIIINQTINLIKILTKLVLHIPNINNQSQLNNI